MNKDDLIAWKNYDNNQYSLIPGVSNQKKFLEREPKNNSSGSLMKSPQDKYFER